MTTAEATLAVDLPVKRMGEVRHNMGGRKGQKFANDGSYESVEAMLTRLAIKSYARVQALKLPMNYEDVRQEMDVYYLQAFKAWRPDGGAKFSSYCTTACMHNFRNRIEKMCEEKRELGMYSIDDRAPSMQDEDGDPMERLGADLDDSRPEDRLIARQEMKQRLAGLTPAAQRFVTALLLNERDDKFKTGTARFSNIAVAAGLNAAEARRVRAEITEKFGFTEW
ncbi:hypothetical protein GFK26_17985 [Variovorax paradoxus]|uniref:Uncharacterized protein n=1 Tax=Variovorax paradoxus TaxID=34073 RepID=A0A5Q0M444_VARPD|nr:hypothetical protein [Variovorax paradoxus]QFZ84520.1 hypothetical protein GFK26_17985 [Variovorax paradoxus]